MYFSQARHGLASIGRLLSSGPSSDTLVSCLRRKGAGLLRIPETSHGWTGVPSPAFGIAARRLGTAASSVAVSAGAVAARAGTAGEQVRTGSLAYWARCYYELSKFRLSLLVASTASAGFVLASGEAIDWARLGWTSLGTMMAASSANAFNQLFEISNDGRMKRTMRRPLPSGRMGIWHAAAFAAVMGIGGVGLLAAKTNTLTAELGAANIALYALAYTPLKQLHVANTWLGALVGAIPPLMGWAAAAGHLDVGAGILAAALYFWQMPHFMALAYNCRKDYAAGGYKMLSLVDATGRRVAAVSLRNCLYLLPLGLLALHLDVVSHYFAAESLLLSGWLGLSAAAFYHQPCRDTARKLFRISLIYLPAFMAGLIVHRVPYHKDNAHTLKSQLDVPVASEWPGEVNVVAPAQGGSRLTTQPGSKAVLEEEDQPLGKLCLWRAAREYGLPRIAYVQPVPFGFFALPGAHRR